MRKDCYGLIFIYDDLKNASVCDMIIRTEILQMKKPIKSLLIVTPICILLVGLTILLCLLDTTFDIDKIVIAIVLSVWAFFIVPAILYAINWAKLHLNNADPARSFRIGMIWGDLIFILLIIAAPVSGILWFVKIIKDIALSKKSDENKSNY